MTTCKGLILFVILAGCGGAEKGAVTGRAAPAVSPNGNVIEYRGPNRMRVSMLRTTGSNIDALIQVTGVESELKDKVIPTTAKNTDRGGLAYVAQLHGEEFWLVTEEKDGQATVLLPEDYRERFQLTRDTDNKPNATAPLLAAFKSGFESGDLPRLAAWNRAEREQRNEAKFAEEFTAANKTCGKEFKLAIDWKSVSDDVMKEKAIYGYCESIADAVEHMCARFPGSREELKAISEIRCSFDGKWGARMEGDALVWVPGQTNLDQQAWSDIVALTGRSPALFKSGEVYIIVDVADSEKPMYFGDGKTFTRQRRTAMGSGPDHHYLFNGSDTKSSLGRDGAEWKLNCGERSTVFAEVPSAERKKIMAAATLKEYSFDREPFALARDDRGTYYYVDQRMKELGGKGFQVHIGKVGAVATTDLKDIVDDSQGMIFSTRTGNLRLILSSGAPMQASWLVGEKKATNLTTLDVWGNTALIFEKLGVYDKVELSTVCDKI